MLSTRSSTAVLAGASLVVLATAPAQAGAHSVTAGRGTQAAAPADASSVTVVHGLAGVIADVALDGKTVLTGFEPDRATDPFPVPAGPHEVEVRRAGNLNSPPLITQRLALRPGSDTTLVAHRDLEGEPVLSAFVNDTAQLPAGKARLVLHNTADLDAAQIVVDGKASGTPAGHRARTAAVVDAGAHTVSVQVPGSPQFVVGNRTVRAAAGTSTLLYLVGSSDDDTLDWLAQDIDARAVPPSGVPAGSAGLKAAAEAGNDVGSTPVAGLLALVTAAGALVAARLRLARRV